MEPEETVIFDYSEENVNNDGKKFEAYKREQSEGASLFVRYEQTQSPEKISSWSDICRICANSNDHIIPIFEAEGAQHDLSDKIHKYLPIRVTKTDTLPIQLCYHCAATILAWHELLEGCADAEKQLLQMQSDRSYTEQNESKYSENLSERPTYDPESMSIDKQEFSLIGQQEEETEENINGEESALRSKKIKAGFGAETSDVSANEKRTREKCVKIFVKNVSDETIVSQFRKNDERRMKTSEGSKMLVIFETNEKKTTEEIDEKKIAKKKIIPKDVYVCDLCGKKFRLRGSLKSHLKLHTGLKYFTCHICGKQFTQNGCLYYHLKHVHGGVKNHSCDICGRSFAMKSTMEDHRRSIHTGERPYICHSCGKTFTTKSSLYIHSRIHTQNYPYECQYCKKSFRWKQQLIGHVTTHTGEKKHSCDVCGKAFGVKNQLTRHKHTHETSKPYTCEKCGMSFGQKRYLSSHERSKHK